MGLLLFRACLVINAFNIATENPVTTKPYRFPVYPVNECPRSKDEFKTAAQRRNCTKGLRYLCAPNKYLSSLIEFCTDRKISLYQEGNCVILEGTGDLDHYSCVEKFNSSCPLEFYNDEEIYKYPACLEIDRELRCFSADNGCKKRGFHTTESHGWPATGYIIATAAVLAVIILSWIIFQKRKREQVERCKDSKDKNENESSLNDNPKIDDDKLQQFLSKGGITICHVRVIIVCCGKAGKMTLLKRLQNASSDGLMQIERTDMADFHLHSFEVLLEEDTIQRTSTVKFETELSPDGETPQFTLKESDQYRKGHYALQMTFSRGKVYIHVQDNHKGKVSLPLDVFDALWAIREDIKAGTDLLRNLASPPSPPLMTIAPEAES